MRYNFSLRWQKYKMAWGWSLKQWTSSLYELSWCKKYSYIPFLKTIKTLLALRVAMAMTFFIVFSDQSQCFVNQFSLLTINGKISSTKIWNVNVNINTSENANTNGTTTLLQMCSSSHEYFWALWQTTLCFSEFWFFLHV